LDPADFLAYEGDVAGEADALSAILGAFITVYDTTCRYNARRLHLCQTYRVAQLAPDRIQMLRAAAERHPGAVFVAYARPLRRLAPVTGLSFVSPTTGLIDSTSSLPGSTSWRRGA
jgi:hypothetical protein